MDDYKKFHQLHHGPKTFLLANAWNVKSAQLIEQAGFEAIATSSGAIANSLGYEDGEKIPFRELLYIVQRIKANTRLPLSVDMERGYSNELNILTDNIQKLIDCGVVGINIEDAQGEDIYLKKLERIKSYLARTHQSLFINARTDVFIQKLPSPLETTIQRAQRYVDAGADGLFVPAVADPGFIKEITSSVSLPVNMVGSPKLSVEALTGLGVKRISMAVLLYKATYHQMESIARSIKDDNSIARMF
ncbi:isocitrate lyase/phosphoenolpyruvate mutase family protein [Taibaiella lutea]|uniref:Isocitrate lyase/phosphoenolpyruvate mutase family protein n=1 Tax=Taibaiella lutea TaxID=2608001 RepID=A0A5M6CT12_9BACT|nr:isocitrate lyase/phosphoenolpyruvate mutase family protein [Taibaiella lutea]KAA5536175.1 isocitrate lyase/phosphoenolpyruvate mutase family protein [Taibaiella lutea]